MDPHANPCKHLSSKRRPAPTHPTDIPSSGYLGSPSGQPALIFGSWVGLSSIQPWRSSHILGSQQPPLLPIHLPEQQSARFPAVTQRNCGFRSTICGETEK